MKNIRKYYSFYHLNIMFSSIPENRRNEVIEKCYWPLLRLACKSEFKISIEATGLTLEIIQALDPKWIVECKKLIQLGKLEFIGSGYSQIIAPLVPGDVNRINLVQGNLVYFELLGIRPKICLVNEMSFSFDLIDIFLHEGYDSIILDVNNFSGCQNFHLERPGKIRSLSGSEINVIWADSICFQQFQRVVHGSINFSSYRSYLENYRNVELPLYSSDAEIFDFRPGRFKEESKIRNHEWAKVEEVYDNIVNSGSKFMHLQEVLDSRELNQVYIENPTKVPIYVKKQDKYNINRWALTGRFDLLLNSYCFSLHKRLIPSNNIDCRFLLQMWSSDFRTHLSKDRVGLLEKFIYDQVKQVGELLPSNTSEITNNEHEANLSNSKLRCTLDLTRGGSVKSLSYNNLDYLGWIPHGSFEELDLAFDYFSLHSVIEPLGERKVTSLTPVNSFIKTDSGIIIRSELEGYSFEKRIELDNCKVMIQKKIHLPSRRKEIIHPFIFTIKPENFDINTLYYSTSNGGLNSVRRMLSENIDMTGSYSHLITSIHSFGNSDGLFTLGDAKRSISFEVDMTTSAILPKIKFIKTKDSFLLRLIYSAQEVDDTFVESNQPWTLDCNISIELS